MAKRKKPSPPTAKVKPKPKVKAPEKKKKWYVRFGIWFENNLPYITKLLKYYKDFKH